MSSVFVPSTEWQVAPPGVVFPNGVYWQTDFDTGQNMVRWDDPVPGPVPIPSSNGQIPPVSPAPPINSPLFSQSPPPSPPPSGTPSYTQPNCRKLSGCSILQYSQRTVNDRNTLLGDRWLCRGGFAFLIGPSGVGKSSLSLQLAIEAAICKTTFGIPVPRALRILIIQSEDDDDDVTEMSQMIEKMNLSDAQRKLVDRNTHIECVYDVVGDSFFPVFEGFLSERTFDLVILNPYSAYSGGDIKDDAHQSWILRQRFNPLLTRFNLAVLGIHHTPKTNFRNTEKWKSVDWFYSSAGAAVLTNSPRANLIIEPTEVDGIYRFIAGKRWQRIGWGVKERYFAHSSDGSLLWLPATLDQQKAAEQCKVKVVIEPDALLEVVPVIDPITLGHIAYLAIGKFDLGEKKVDTFIKILVSEGKVFRHEFSRPKKKAEIKYAKTEQTLV